MIIDASGKVGIGLSNPSQRLEVGGPNAILAVFDTRPAAIDVGGVIYLRGYYNGTSDPTDFARIVGGKENNSQPDDSGYLAFRTRKGVYQGDFERLRITSAGDVGIGTAAPAAKLEVAGTVLANVTDPLAYQLLNAGKTEGLVIDTTNKAVRPLTDNAYSLGAGAQRWSSLRVGAGDSSFAGNLGVGVTTPGVKLDVAGDIKASGNIVANSGGKVLFNGPGGNRYLVDNPTNEWIEVAGQFAVGGGFHQEPDPGGDLGLTIDDNGTIQTNGNFQVLRTDPSHTPIVWHLGRQGFQTTGQSVIPRHTNYFFWQDRVNREGWWWTGWNSFRHPATLTGGPNTEATVPRGYGYYPLRSMAKNILFEASGEIVSSYRLMGPAIYFQAPLHIDLNPASAPQTEPPLQAGAKYTSDLRPYIERTASTTLAATVSAGSTQISVNNASGFSADDEIFIGTAINSEINEVASVSGTTIYLKRDTKEYLGGNEPVKQVRELGAVQPDRSTGGLAVYIKRNVDDLVFKDNRGAEITLQQIRQALGL